VRLDLVQRAMERDAKTNIIFLDACRNNPLARNLARAIGTRSAGIPHGLAPVESGIGTLVSFSTQPGNVALDGEGRNSPFAGALVKHIGDDEPITDVLISVRNDVVAATNQQQVPWEHSALRSRFYFKRPSARRLAPSHMPGADASFEQRAELALWRSIKHSKNVAVLQSFLNQFPNGRFANTVRIMIQLLKDEHRQAALAEQRKFDAEMANQQKQAALAQESKAKHKAEIAKKGTEYQAALEDVRKAREAARDAERRQVEAEQAAEKARLGAQASGAALQQKSTEAPSPPVSAAALPDRAASGNSADRSLSSAPQTLISDIQKQLKRVGCYTASVDGAWSDTSKAALQQFARQAKIAFSTEGPTQEVLKVLRASKEGICSQTASRENGSSGERATSTQPTDRPTSGRLNFGAGGIGF